MILRRRKEQMCDIFGRPMARPYACILADDPTGFGVIGTGS